MTIQFCNELRGTGQGAKHASLRPGTLIHHLPINEDTHMRKPIAILAALGFLGATSLPAVSAPATTGVVKSDDLSAAKKKAKKAKKKKAELTVTDLSAAKKKAKKAKKKAELSVVTDLSAAKKKAKKAKKKAENVILYRIAA